MKTPDPDFLGLRPKPNVTCIAFVDPGDERKVLIGHPGQVGTEHHTVMLYDTSAGLRPVQKLNFGEVRWVSVQRRGESQNTLSAQRLGISALAGVHRRDSILCGRLAQDALS